MWGQPVIIDNRPGAGGTIGAGIVAKSPPDGYTLLVHSAAQAVQPVDLPEPAVRHGRRISSRSRPLGGQPNVLVVAPATGYKTVADLIAAAKKSPGSLNFGSAGTGSGTHINGEKFKLAAGIDVVHIPYKGTPEALTDTMTGRVTYFFSPISAALPKCPRRQADRAGREHGQAFQRAAQRTDDRRGGLPGFDYNLWVGMFAPAGTPNDIVDKINGRGRVLQTPEVRSDWPRWAPSRCR
jgi:tripartite-type tricarboxylate transporter receptor subunit TctC